MKTCLILLLALLLTGCRQETSTVDLSQESLHSLLSPEQAQAQAVAAFELFSETLKAELLTAMEEGGPVQAVEVCSLRAPEIAQSISEELGFALGRSSHRVRNPGNAPNEVLRAYLLEHAEKPASEAGIQVVPYGSDLMVIAPIATAPLCLTCHGDPTTFTPKLIQALGDHYPEDEATGFEAGELRGVFWASMPQDAEVGDFESSVPGTVPLSGPSSRKIKTH